MNESIPDTAELLSTLASFLTSSSPEFPRKSSKLQNILFNSECESLGKENKQMEAVSFIKQKWHDMSEQV